MASKILGIEIGTNTLKLALIVKGAVQKLAVQRMPDDLVRESRVTSAAAMAQFLKQMCKDNGISAKDCAMVLPGQVVIANRVTMPAMNEKELKLNLPFEFRDFVGKEGAKYDYDYSVIRIDDISMDLYAAAVRKDIVEEYYDIFKKAGLTLRLAIPAEMAWANLIRTNPELPEIFAIMDAGHHTTRGNIYHNDNFVMGKDIGMAGALIDETIANAQEVDSYVAHNRKEANMDDVLTSELVEDAYRSLVIEIMKTLTFYGYSNTEDADKLQDVYYCGGTSVIEPLRETMEKATGLRLHPAHELFDFGAAEENKELAIYCALAVGAAIQK